MKYLPFFSREFPKFKAKPVEQWLSMMAKNNGSPAPCSREDLPHFHTCLEQIFQFNPDMRPSCKALLENPYFASCNLGPSCENMAPTNAPGSNPATFPLPSQQVPVQRKSVSSSRSGSKGSSQGQGSGSRGMQDGRDADGNVEMADAQDAEGGGRGGDNRNNEKSDWTELNVAGLSLTEMKC